MTYLSPPAITAFIYSRYISSTRRVCMKEQKNVH